MLKSILIATLTFVSAKANVYSESDLENFAAAHQEHLWQIDWEDEENLMENTKSSYIMAKEKSLESPRLQQTYTGTPYDTARFWAIMDWSAGFTTGLYVPMVRTARHGDCFSYWFSTVMNLLFLHQYFDQAYTMAWYNLAILLGSTGYQAESTVAFCLKQYTSQEKEQWFDVFERANAIQKAEKKGEKAPESSKNETAKADTKKDGKAKPQAAQSLLKKPKLPQDVFGFPLLKGTMNDPSFIMVASQAGAVGASAFGIYSTQRSKFYFFENGYSFGNLLGNSLILVHWWFRTMPFMYSVKPWVRYQVFLPKEVFEGKGPYIEKES